MGIGETNAGREPCDGPASHPGGVKLLLVAYNATETWPATRLERRLDLPIHAAYLLCILLKQ